MLICALMLVGCTAPQPKASISDPDASVKIRGIRGSVHQHDQATLEQLVADLDSDDAAVRFYSIEALQRITGQTMDYRYYDESLARQPAIQRWQQWLSQQSQTETTQPAD